jgi:ATP-binding cassette subfamily B protein
MKLLNLNIDGELIKVFWQQAIPYKKYYYAALGLMTFSLAFELALPLILKQGLDAVQDGDTESLYSAATLFLGVLIGEFVCRGGFSYLASVGFLRTINDLRDRVFSHVLRLKMAFFDKQPVGRLLTRTVNDSEALSESLRMGVITIFQDFLRIPAFLILMYQIEWGLATIVVVAVPLVILAVRWCGGRLKERFLAVRKALAEANGVMAEGIGGVEILQLFRQQAYAEKQFRDANKDYRFATITSNVYDALLYALIDGIAALVTAAVLYAALGLEFRMVDAAAIVVFVGLIEKIFVPIRDLSGKLATIQQASAALQRILELLNTPASIPQGKLVPANENLTIKFDDVKFRYMEDGPLVLKGVSFDVKPGQVVALVGETGSGKSTIGKLLTRAYDGYEGTVCVGGIELDQVNYHALRQRVAVVHQDIELFPGSLRDNISMFNDEISEEKIWWAIKLVKAEHMVQQLPGGLDFEVAENGNNLSSGQMQLTVFARALAHDAPIVLMDEATASVDSVTEAWIQEAIAQIFKHKTVIIVAHRLSTIARANQILVLRRGEITERGTHQELLAIEGGYYASLVHASDVKGSHSYV